jgi:hypothetical protein
LAYGFFPKKIKGENKMKKTILVSLVGMLCLCIVVSAGSISMDIDGSGFVGIAISDGNNLINNDYELGEGSSLSFNVQPSGAYKTQLSTTSFANIDTVTSNTVKTISYSGTFTGATDFTSRQVITNEIKFNTNIETDSPGEQEIAFEGGSKYTANYDYGPLSGYESGSSPQVITQSWSVPISGFGNFKLR